MGNGFTPAAENAIEQAREEAIGLGHGHIGTEHLLLGLLRARGSVGCELLRAKGIEYSNVRECVLRHSPSSDVTGIPERTPRLRAVIEASKNDGGGAFGRSGTEILLRELLSEGSSGAVRVLRSMGVTVEELQSDVCAAIRGGGRLIGDAGQKDKRDKALPPSLSKYASPMSASDPIIGRDAETESLIRVLCRRNKSNPCLIGEPGVGKTAIVEGLAQRIREGNVPDALKGKTVLALDLPSMLAGAKYRGDFEDRLKSILSEAAKSKRAILFIDELHTVMGAGASEGAIDASNILKPELARGTVSIIGATTTEEYRRFIERDSAFERRLQPIPVSEPTEECAEQMLRGLKRVYEEHHGISITDSAIRQAVSLSVRYIPERRLPDKAIDLLDDSLSGKRIAIHREKEAKMISDSLIRGIEASGSNGLGALKGALMRDTPTAPILTARDVKDTLALRIGYTPTEPDPSHLSEYMNRSVFGREDTVNELCSALQTKRFFGSKDSPRFSLLLYGGEGCGKTHMARTFSEALFGSEPICFDLSEYAEKSSVSSLIGSPPGYVGYRDEGALIKELKTSPNRLLLLENVDRAHPDVLSVIREALERGSVTSPTGRSVDVRGTVIVATCTVCPRGASAGFSLDRSLPDRNILKELLPASFISRIDKCLFIPPLSRSSLNAIVSARLSAISSTLSESGVTLCCDPSLKEQCISDADSSLGGHGVLSSVKRNVEEEIARYLSSCPLPFGSRIRIFAENRKICVGSVTDDGLFAYNTVNEDCR